MTYIIISFLFSQHQPSNLKCLPILIKATWVARPYLWDFYVIPFWKLKNLLPYKTGNRWVLSLALGIPDIGSDHNVSKLSPIIRKSETKRNLSRMPKHQKQFFHNQELKLMPKLMLTPQWPASPAHFFPLCLYIQELDVSLLKFRPYMAIEVKVEAKEIIK